MVYRCLAFHPRHRYPDARRLAKDLEGFLVAEPIWARPAGMVERLSPDDPIAKYFRARVEKRELDGCSGGQRSG